MNGGQLYTGHDNILREYDLLQLDAIQSIVEMIKPLDLNPFIYGQNNTIICKRADSATKASEKRNSMSLHVVKNLNEFWQKPVNKIMFRTTEQRMHEVKQWPDTPNFQVFH